MTASEVKALLGLEAHPREGGWYRRTFESPAMAAVCLQGVRLAGTAIYYLLEPETFSEMHKLASDEIFHFYAGDAVEQLQLKPDGRAQLVVIGADLKAGQRPQVVVPSGVWQGARLISGGRWALLGCTVTPGFDYEDYEGGSAAALCALWPQWAEMVRELCRG